MSKSLKYSYSGVSSAKMPATEPHHPSGFRLNISQDQSPTNRNSRIFWHHPALSTAPPRPPARAITISRHNAKRTPAADHQSTSRQTNPRRRPPEYTRPSQPYIPLPLHASQTLLLHILLLPRPVVALRVRLCLCDDWSVPWQSSGEHHHSEEQHRDGQRRAAGDGEAAAGQLGRV